MIAVSRAPTSPPRPNLTSAKEAAYHRFASAFRNLAAAGRLVPAGHRGRTHASRLESP